MKKKVLKGWVTVDAKGDKLTSFSCGDFFLYAKKITAEDMRDGVSEGVVKVKVTIEPV